MMGSKMKLNDKQKQTLERLINDLGGTATRKQIVDWVKRTSGVQFEGNRVPKGVDFPHFITNNKNFRAGRGAYNLVAMLEAGPTETMTSGDDLVGTDSDAELLR